MNLAVAGTLQVSLGMPLRWSFNARYADQAANSHLKLIGDLKMSELQRRITSQVPLENRPLVSPRFPPALRGYSCPPPPTHTHTYTHLAVYQGDSGVSSVDSCLGWSLPDHWTNPKDSLPVIILLSGAEKVWYVRTSDIWPRLTGRPGPGGGQQGRGGERPGRSYSSFKVIDQQAASLQYLSWLHLPGGCMNGKPLPLESYQGR